MNPLLNKNELYAPGGQSMIGGGVRSAKPPVVPIMNVAPTAPTPAAAPTPTAAPRESVAETYARAQAVSAGLPQPTAPAKEPTVAESFQSPGFETGYPTYEELYPEIDENKIRRQQLKMYQAEINATNQIYDQMLNESKMEGTGRLGSQRAAAARGGLLGSDFGAAQEDKVTDYNSDQNNLVRQQRTAAIGAIMGTVRKSVADEIAAKRAARKEGADNYISYLTGSRERKNRNLSVAAQALITQGIDPSTLSPDELKAIADEAGLKPNEVINQYRIEKASADSAATANDLKTRKTEAEINKIEADIESGKLITLGEGTMLYNPETGETFKNPKTYAPSTGSGGSGNGTDYITTDNKKQLLGSGFSEDEISAIAEDVKTNGLDAVLENAKVNGATSAQLQSLRDVYKAGEDTTEFLSKDYFSKLFTADQLKDAARSAGFDGGFLGKTDTDGYLSYIDGVITQYRLAGYNDKDILKMMQ